MAGGGQPPATPAFLAKAARAAEERGFHSLWVGEHVVLFDAYAKEYPYSDSGEFPLSGEGGMTVQSALSGYTFGFWLLLGAGLLLFLIAPLVQRLMHGVK